MSGNGADNEEENVPGTEGGGEEDNVPGRELVYYVAGQQGRRHGIRAEFRKQS